MIPTSAPRKSLFQPCFIRQAEASPNFPVPVLNALRKLKGDFNTAITKATGGNKETAKLAKEYEELLFNYRNTWAGFPGSPKSYAAHYNGEIANNVGVGAYLVNDSYANLMSLRGSLSFAYMIKGESYKIGAGLSTQFQRKLAQLQQQAT